MSKSYLDEIKGRISKEERLPGIHLEKERVCDTFGARVAFCCCDKRFFDIDSGDFKRGKALSNVQHPATEPTSNIENSVDCCG